MLCFQVFCISRVIFALAVGQFPSPLRSNRSDSDSFSIASQLDESSKRVKNLDAGRHASIDI